ncbi:MAG: helix-turn-helix domain-containing protein [Bacteroidales bacterium]|nr:helix-turn-helix domain-containing protein [Bacteroidales bacterium]
MVTNILGKEIARVRKEKNLTQEQLGKRIGLPKSSISKMENGITKLTLEDASILFEAMGEKMVLPTTIVMDSKGELQKGQLMICAIEWFADSKGISLEKAFDYLLAFRGIDFLEDN